MIRRLRTERGLTQAQLAELTGLHRTEISLVERSERMPQLDSIVAFCRGLGLTPAELLDQVEIGIGLGCDFPHNPGQSAVS